MLEVQVHHLNFVHEAVVVRGGDRLEQLLFFEVRARGQNRRLAARSLATFRFELVPPTLTPTIWPPAKDVDVVPFSPVFEAAKRPTGFRRPARGASH